MALTTNTAQQVATYSLSFRPLTADTLQTIVLEVCANNPFPGTPCTAPSGFDASSAVLISQSGDTGFQIAPGQSTANRIVLTRPPVASQAQQDTYVLGGVHNPTSSGSYYARLQTYADGDTSGEATNYGGIAFAIASPVSIRATVPPYLLFCAGITITGYNCNNVTVNYVNFGELASNRTAQGSSQLLAATNAQNGYGIRASGTTMTSGNNTIDPLLTSDASRPGVGQFGFNLRANGSPSGGQDASGQGSGQPATGYDRSNFYRFNSGELIAGSPSPDEARKYTLSYIVNVSSSQAPGVYVATLTFTALGTF